MSFIHRFSLKAKLYILSIFILSSLIGIATVGYNNITTMKKNLDALYFGSLVPITTLNKIINVYNHDIKDTIYLAEKNTLFSHTLSKPLVQINTLWNAYVKSYKEEKELPFIEYTTTLIIQNENNLLAMIESCFQGCDAKKIGAMHRVEDIKRLENALTKLIQYENEVAQFQRHELLNNYNNTLFRMSIFLVLVIIIVMVLSFIIFKSINRTQNRLKQTTQELQISNKKLENASYTDALTRLFNRRYFNLVYERELRRAKRSKSTLSFMMLDIDFFKQYNDTYGHLEGDQALKTVAKTLKSLLKRPSDYVFRLGGEEFGVLLTEDDKSSASLLADQINRSIQECEIPHAGSTVSNYLSISIGLVIVEASMDLDNEKLLSEADKNLYQAKEEGRNRFISSVL
ncbi:MAG: diguanylate cyclase [Campylobacterota bacterium]|nr:diguanylate cyclase [Campylobacterota bacterium]